MLKGTEKSPLTLRGTHIKFARSREPLFCFLAPNTFAESPAVLQTTPFQPEAVDPLPAKSGKCRLSWRIPDSTGELCTLRTLCFDSEFSKVPSASCTRNKLGQMESSCQQTSVLFCIAFNVEGCNFPRRIISLSPSARISLQQFA